MIVQRGPQALKDLAGDVPAIDVPDEPMTDTVKFDPDAEYRIRLSSLATFRGVDMPATALHTVTGTVAEAVRPNIAAFRKM